jgi:cysteine-rich repeat protein
MHPAPVLALAALLSLSAAAVAHASIAARWSALPGKLPDTLPASDARTDFFATGDALLIATAGGHVLSYRFADASWSSSTLYAEPRPDGCCTTPCGSTTQRPCKGTQCAASDVHFDDQGNMYAQTTARCDQRFGEEYELTRWDGSVLRRLGLFSRDRIRDVAAAADSLYVAWGNQPGTISRMTAGTWRSLGTEYGSSVHDLDASADDVIAAGGMSSGIIQWNGAQWRPLGGGLDIVVSYEGVQATVRHGGDLVVAGRFGVPGGASARFPRVVRLAGERWEEMGTIPETAAPGVIALASADTHLFAATSSRVYVYSGGDWQPVGESNGAIHALIATPAGLVVSGSFRSIGGTDAPGLALFDLACGNGRTEAGEECDDGNYVDSDQCSALCRRQAGDARAQKLGSAEACNDAGTAGGCR